MKTKYFSLVVVIFVLTACSKDFIDRFPLDQISSQDYWKTTSDARLYAHSFYPALFNLTPTDQYAGIFSKDIHTDDFLWVDAYDKFRGSTQIPASGGWDYTRIRSLNYFLENYQTIESNFDEYKVHVGEVRLFRALTYFELVKRYGDVPWVGKTLTTESEELFYERTPRNIVIDSVIKDIDIAIDLLPNASIDGGTRFNKNIAELIKSRVSLYEGTWEKYHSGGNFSVTNSDPNKYLTMAAESAKNVMNSGQYAIHNTGNPDWDYFMFGEVDYSQNSEVLFWKKNDRELELTHRNQYQMANGNSGGSGMTKELIESYLCTDGNPITKPDNSPNSLYMGDSTLETTLENRDPRVKQTIFSPGFTIKINHGNDTIKYVRANIAAPTHTVNTTGYQLCKGLNWDPEHSNLSQNDGGTTGNIIYRYAEVLLNYAEAKAELGTLTQADVDMSINKLRERVNMPGLILGNILTDPNWNFPTLTPEINEIRRERRVELVAEGFRWSDIARWAAADELVVGKRYKGAKFNDIDYPSPEFNSADYNLTDGYFDYLKNILPGGYGFDVNRDYLSPISTEELTLNPNLLQNPGWD